MVQFDRPDVQNPNNGHAILFFVNIIIFHNQSRTCPGSQSVKGTSNILRKDKIISTESIWWNRGGIKHNISVSIRWIPAFSVLIFTSRPSLLKLTPYLLFSHATFKCNLKGPISFFLAFRRSAYKHWRLFHLPVVLLTSSSINSPSGGCWPWKHRGSNWRLLSSVVALHFGTAKVSQMATLVKHTRVLWLLCNLELFKSLSTHIFWTLFCPCPYP